MSVKPSQLPADSSPASADFLVGDQASGPITKSFTLSALTTFFWTLGNIPSGATNPVTRDNEMQQYFVASGLVWSADSAGVNRNASMTAGVCYVNGRRISISAVTARTFTASKDTYVDILDNGDGTGTLVYTEVTNNAASPALAANSIRIGIVVTGASSIAAAASINQGQEDRILPIASSIAYSVTDSLGNLICNRDPQALIIGYRRITADFSYSTSSAATQITGLTCPVIVPTNRKVEVICSADISSSVSDVNDQLQVWDGTVGSGTKIAQRTAGQNGGTVDGNVKISTVAEDIVTPTSSSKTYNGGLQSSSASATNTVRASAGAAAWIKVRLA